MAITQEQYNALKYQAQNSLISFCVWTDKYFEVSDHHIKITRALERVERGECKRLIISVPPRHGKSRIASEEFPARFLGRHPDKYVMVTSYSYDLAQTFSRRSRTRVESYEYRALFDTKISKTAGQISHRETEDKGGYIASGVGGSITGKGFHIGIIDDPISNDEEANSSVMKNKIWDRYQSTFYTRQEKDAAIIVIMTRRAEDDLVGRILENAKASGETREGLKLQAIEDGVPLRENKYSKEKLDEIKKTIGLLKRQSLYMQEPFAEEGIIFQKDMFRFYDRSRLFNDDGSIYKKMRIVTFIDPAISQKQEADETAIVTIAVDENNDVRVLDDFHARIEPGQIIDEVFRIVQAYKPDKVGIEVVQYQKMLAQEIKNQMRIKGQFFILEEVHPMGEKNARIRTNLHARLSNKTVRMRKDMIDLQEQLIKFPNGKHDDIIDALSSAIYMLEPKRQTNSTDKQIRYYTDPLTGERKIRS